jgi:hypothetical protein
MLKSGASDVTPIRQHTGFGADSNESVASGYCCRSLVYTCSLHLVTREQTSRGAIAAAAAAARLLAAAVAEGGGIVGHCVRL